MECKVALDQITDYLVRGAHVGEPTPQDALAHAAGCRRCLQTLTELGPLWTDQPSLLSAASDLLTCHECQDLLPAYVDAPRAARTVFAERNRVAHHLEHCRSCQEQYALLAELVEEIALADGRATAPAALWHLVDERVRELVAPLRIQLDRWGAAFAAWPAALSDLLPAPQLIAAPSLRHSGDKRLDELLTRAAHWVELPDAANNMLIRVGTGATQETQTTIVFKLTTLSPAAPLGQCKVSLRDEGGNLLERVATDADGLVLFQHLPGGKYRLTVEQANRQWDVNVFIEEPALSS